MGFFLLRTVLLLLLLCLLEPSSTVLGAIRLGNLTQSLDPLILNTIRGRLRLVAECSTACGKSENF